MNKDGGHNNLEIKDTAYSDSGKYVCTATNVLGQVQKQVSLFVEGNDNEEIKKSIINNCDDFIKRFKLLRRQQ